MTSIKYDADELLNGITDEMMEDMKFLGRDPSELIKKLISKEANEATRNHDLAILTTLVALRGTKISKIQSRTSAKGVKLITGLIAKYGIVAHTKETPMSSPTLPRIASLMPMVTFKLRIRNRDLFSEVGNGAVPIEFQFPACGAILDDKSMPTWLSWYESFCTAVGITFSKENAEIGHRFSTVPDADRISL